MTLDPTDTDPTSDTTIRGALLNQLLAGPTYPEVAAVLLRDALKELYPSLDLDPYTTVLGEPTWDIIDDEIVQLPTRYESLSNLLADQMDNSQPTLLVEGLHFLTQLPITVPEVHLPVRIDQIGRLINELAPAMLTAVQEQQLAYWNVPFGNTGPRWHELSDTLRKFWDVRQVKGWTAKECDMARQLFLYPEPKDRKDAFNSHAYLVDLEAVDGNQVTRLNENSLIVLIGRIDDQEVILTHSLYSGYEKFDSRQALGQSIASHLVRSVPATGVRWRLYEPRGNIFDTKACGLIAVQVKVVGSPLAEADPATAEVDIPISGLTNGPGEAWFQQQITEAKKRALHHLAKALDERSMERLMGKAYEERPQPRRKFIRARFWGIVSGTHIAPDLVEVKNPFSEQTIATFHRKETGQWVPRLTYNATQPVPALETSLRKGKALIDGLPAFKAQIEKDLQKPDRTPSGIALILSAHANRLETVGVAIRKAIEREQSSTANETVKPSSEKQSSAKALQSQLRTESTALYDQEREAVLSLIKQRPPTMSDVIWLRDRNLVQITQLIKRKRIRTPRTKSYLDRYEIKDKTTDKTLWFADFQYSSDWTSANSFLSARLRTPEQINSKLTEVPASELSERQLIDRYHGEIAVDEAMQVFFAKKPHKSTDR